MPKYKFKALLPDGQVVVQTVQSINEKELALTLKTKGWSILSIKKESTGLGFWNSTISSVDKANFCRYMSIMMRSGLSVTEAVEILHHESDNPAMQSFLSELSFGLQHGEELSVTLAKHPENFDKVFLALVKAGEKSGSLEKTFSYLSNQLYSIYRLNKRVQSAMMYPAVIFFAMGGVGVLMMTFVLPRLSTVFLKMKIPLPLPTKMLLNFGEFVGNHTFLVIGMITFAILFVSLLLKYQKTHDYIFKIATNAPVIRRIFIKIDLARFARTLATLLQSGVPIMNALAISSAVFTQTNMAKIALTFQKGMSEGKTVSDLLVSDKKVFPPLMIQTIKTGEKTGTLDSILFELADFYESELDDVLRSLISILEPVIMLVIGVAVGAIVIMIIAPIYSVLGSLQGGPH